MTQSPPPSDQQWSDPAASQPVAGSSNTYASTTGSSAVAEPRPGKVTWGSIVLIVLGALTILIGLLFLLGGAILSGAASGGLEGAEGVPAGFGDMAGAFAGAAIVIALIVLAWGILEIVVAAKAMGGRNWARITGIVLAAIGALFTLLGLLGSFGAGGTDAQQAQNAGVTGVVINVVLLAAYAFVIYAYATAGRWFSSRG